MVRAMRRNSRAVHLLFRLRWLLSAFLLTCVVASVYAGVRVNASGIRSTGVTATGVRTAATLEATFTGTMNGVKTYGVSVPVSSSTLGSLAKSALKRGAGAYGWYTVAKGLIDGAGWAINELQQQVIDPGTQVPLELVGWCRDKKCASTMEGLLPWARVNFPAADPASVRTWVAVQTGEKTGNLYAVNYAGTYVVMVPVVLVSRPVAGWQGYENVGTGTGRHEVSDQDLGNLLKQSPQVVNAILIDPETGAPIRTQELVEAMNDLRRQLEAANGLDPGTDVSPTDDMTKPEVRESDWPAFCNWAGMVCDFMDWWMSDDTHTEKPEVPWEEESPTELAKSWSSGLGGGSCPGSISFTVALAGGSASPEFSFEPLCGFATMMRPVIIALAAIIAGFIVAGIRGTKDA